MLNFGKILFYYYTNNMRLQTPKNSNYCATVVRIKNILPLENCDNVVATNIFGFQAIIGKNVQVGDIGVVFTVETQLSHEFCSNNNLYRHTENNINSDPNKKGYIEDNRRVKAVKFRGNRSDALFMSLSSFEYLGINIDDFNEGDTFDELDGNEICKKYEVIRRNSGRSNYQPKAKMFVRVDTKYIPEHFTTDNYFKNAEMIPPDSEVIVTQKIHGTSIRVANTIVKRKKTIRDRLASFIGVKIQETEFDMVFGSRKVIKDINNPHHNHFYDVVKDGIDLWTREGKKLDGLVPENFILYGEIVGWTDTNAPIQQGYTYNLPIGTCSLYIYRIAFVNEKGLVVDLTWDQMKEFCFQRGLNLVPEIFRGKHKDFVATEFLDKQLKKIYAHCLPLDSEETVDEGVCIRVDKLTPYILKAKSPKFFEHETNMLNKEVVDMESSDS